MKYGSVSNLHFFFFSSFELRHRQRKWFWVGRVTCTWCKPKMKEEKVQGHKPSPPLALLFVFLGYIALRTYYFFLFYTEVMPLVKQMFLSLLPSSRKRYRTLSVNGLDLTGTDTSLIFSVIKVFWPTWPPKTFKSEHIASKCIVWRAIWCESFGNLEVSYWPIRKQFMK